MAEYKHSFNFENVTAFKKALEVYKAILEATNSSYELSKNVEYTKICNALAAVNDALQEDLIMTKQPKIIESFIPCTPRWGIRVQDEACWGYGKTILFIDRKYAKNDGPDAPVHRRLPYD